MHDRVGLMHNRTRYTHDTKGLVQLIGKKILYVLDKRIITLNNLPD